MVDDVEALAARLGKSRRDDRRQGRLHRQRAAVRLPQPRRLDVRVPLRQPRGHRRRHAAGLRPADGPARADGPDRHRHRLRDPRHDVQAVARPAARAEPDHQADDDRRAAGPEVRPRLLHLRRAGLAEVVPDAQTPSAGRCRRRAPARSRTVGVVGSGTMATGIIEVFAKAGYDVRFVARSAGEGRGRAGRRWPRVLDKAGQRGRLDRGRRGTPPWPGSPAPPSLDDLADVDLVVEAVVEDAAGQAGAVRRPRRDLQARARCWPPRRPRLPVIECAAATRPARRRRRAALLQPRPGDEAGRGGLAPSPPPTTSRPPRTRSVPPAGQAPGVLRRPGRLHRQRAAVPLPQRRGEDAARRTTPPPTTSTRR